MQTPNSKIAHEIATTFFEPESIEFATDLFTKSLDKHRNIKLKPELKLKLKLKPTGKSGADIRPSEDDADVSASEVGAGVPSSGAGADVPVCDSDDKLNTLADVAFSNHDLLQPEEGDYPEIVTAGVILPSDSNQYIIKTQKPFTQTYH